MADQLYIQMENGTRPGHRVARLKGVLTLLTVPDFLRTIKAETAPALVLDFSGVTMVDSAGIGALVQIFAALNKSQRALALAGINNRTRAVLEITRVVNLFQIYANIDEAENNLT